MTKNKIEKLEFQVYNPTTKMMDLYQYDCSTAELVLEDIIRNYAKPG